VSDDAAAGVVSFERSETDFGPEPDEQATAAAPTTRAKTTPVSWRLARSDPKYAMGVFRRIGGPSG
jgi:hypothetical protein